MLATIVDFSALWKILLAVLLVGVGVTALFGQGAAALSRLRSDDDTTTVLDGTLVGLAALACVPALLVGLYAIMHK